MQYKFTDRAEKVLQVANDIAISLGHKYVGTEHVLYGLAEVKECVASKILESQNVTATNVIEKIEALIGKEEKLKVAVVGFTPRTKRVIENALNEARKLGSDNIGTEHLLIGIMKEADSIAVRIMIELNVNSQKLYNEIVKLIREYEVGEEQIKRKSRSSNINYNATPTLNQYGTDLTKFATDEKLDPVIGRKNEIERIIQTLSRRTKNNPCLIGEPGVGKTAVVEGLAEKIVSGDVPETLKNKRVVSLDIASMVAGAKYRGDFEERIKKCLKEVNKSGNIILFIDEIHNIVGAGAAEGAIDAANILKPLMSRGEIQIIGATTLNEYRKYIEKDSALERRFQQILVTEPTIDESIKILQGLRNKYEAHHNVIITDEAIKLAVNLSSKYINDRALPDKAIDLIDEAASKSKLRTYTEPNSIKKQEEKLESIKKEKEEAIQLQNFEKAAELRDEELVLKVKLEKSKERWSEKISKEVKQINEEDISAVISNWTGIPLQKINENENEKLKNLEKILHERVVGQNEAVIAISKAIKRSRVGLKDPKRPIGSFLFLGPTGVGKTELSKALAETLFGNENSIIRVDMSEYMESNSTAKMIGAPPGYVGFEDAGGLTEKVRRKPYSVILFDEVEKAHPDVMNMLLQILEDGNLTDSHGVTVNFKNTIIVMTSNIGARIITDKNILGFSSNTSEDEKEAEEYKSLKKEVMGEVKKTFRPELINRIDDIIVFHKLKDEEIAQIADIMLEQVKQKLEEKKFKITIEKTAKDYIVKEGIDSKYGARPLRRAIQSILENRLAEEILAGNLVEGKVAKVFEKDGKILVE